MGRPPWPYGRTVVDGEVRFLSPSAMTVADPASDGCLRKWWFQQFRGIRSPQTKAQKTGEGLHAELEKYLLTGEKALSALALSGLHMVPEPGPDLGVEFDIVGGDLATAPLVAEGVPIAGYIDLVHARGINKGTEDITEAIDPPKTIEVIDWKTTSDTKWIKGPYEMAHTIQMTSYAMWAFTVAGAHADNVRLSHGYFITKGLGRARKVSLRVVRENVEPGWEHIRGVVRSVKHAARETDPDKVEANTRACTAFGGCPARDVCKAGMHAALASFVGQAAADRILNKPRPAGAEDDQNMGLNLLQQMKERAQVAQASAAAPSTPPATPEPAVSMNLAGLFADDEPATAPVDAPADDAAKKAAAIAALEAEEADLRERAQFIATLEKVEAYKLGQPTFAGRAAEHFAKGRGAAAPSGKLAKVNVTILAELQGLLGDLEKLAAAGKIASPNAAAAATSAPTSILPPETPAATSSPAPSVPSATTTTAPNAGAVVAGEPTNPPGSVSASADAPVGTAKAPRAPRKKAAEQPPPAPPSEGAPSDAPPAVAEDSSLSLFVDCPIVEGIATQSLHPKIDQWCADLCKEFNAADIRCAPDKSPLGFGKWPGALAAVAREKEIPPGVYRLDARGNPIAEVVAEVMRARCLATGGVYVRGPRP